MGCIDCDFHPWIRRFIDFLALVFEVKSQSNSWSGTDNQLVVFSGIFSKKVALYNWFRRFEVCIELNISNPHHRSQYRYSSHCLATRESLENPLHHLSSFETVYAGDLRKVESNTVQLKIGLRSTRICIDHKTFVTVPNKKPQYPG